MSEALTLNKQAEAAKKLAGLNLHTEYRTGTSDPIKDFYVPCLSQSILYKRAVGYFRSSIYHVAGLAIIDFARRGGKIKLVCSPELKEDDLAAISWLSQISRGKPYI